MFVPPGTYRIGVLQKTTCVSWHNLGYWHWDFLFHFFFFLASTCSLDASAMSGVCQGENGKSKTRWKRKVRNLNKSDPPAFPLGCIWCLTCNMKSMQDILFSGPLCACWFKSWDGAVSKVRVLKLGNLSLHWESVHRLRKALPSHVQFIVRKANSAPPRKLHWCQPWELV